VRKSGFNSNFLPAHQTISILKSDMSLHVQHSSLPYYDPPLTDEEQDLVDELINPLLPKTTKEHPFVASLPSPPPPSPFWSQEYERLSRNEPLNAINTEQYQTPTDTKANLIAAEYLTNRTDNLALLEAYGSNSWLIGNSTQEQSLGILETVLAQLKEEGTEVNRERKRQNLELGGKIDELGQRWRKALRGVIEVEIACAGLQEEIRELEGQSQG
jgi:pre-mRNA-splicing factor SPF27